MLPVVIISSSVYLYLRKKISLKVFFFSLAEVKFSPNVNSNPQLLQKQNTPQLLETAIFHVFPLPQGCVTSFSSSSYSRAVFHHPGGHELLRPEMTTKLLLSVSFPYYIRNLAALLPREETSTTV